MTINVKRFLFSVCSILATIVSSMVLALVQFHFLGRSHAVTLCCKIYTLGNAHLFYYIGFLKRKKIVTDWNFLKCFRELSLSSWVTKTP